MNARRRFLGWTVGASASAALYPFTAFAQLSSTARLILLGTKGGPGVRDVGHMPTSHALIVGESVYIIDAGYGVTHRLVQKKISLPNIRAVFITHHHSDHNLELGPLLYNAWANSATRSVDVYGPDGVEPLVRTYFESNKFDIETRIADEGRLDLRKMVNAKTFREGPVMENDQVRVSALRNLHPPITESYALKFEIKGGKTVVFSGDTAYFPPLAAFAQGSDYLVHEVMYGPALERVVQLNPNAKTLMEHLRASHTLTDDVGRIAAQANVKNLVLSHFVPGGDSSVTDDDWKRGVQAHYGGNIIVGRDLLEIQLD